MQDVQTGMRRAKLRVQDVDVGSARDIIAQDVHTGVREIRFQDVKDGSARV